MRNTLNALACIIAAALFGGMAAGEIDQPFLNSDAVQWFWAPCVAFTYAAWLNLAKKD